MSNTLIAAELPADAVEMGRITDAWGIKGWVKVHAYSASAEALLSGTKWFLQPPVPPYDRGFTAFSGTVQVAVTEVKPHADVLVALCDASPHRTAAEGLKGARIFMSRSEFPQTGDPDEHYWVDLLGLRVVNREGVEQGVVRDLMATGPHSLLGLECMRGGKAVERLIPFVSAYVDHVDKVAGLITVDWQEEYD